MKRIAIISQLNLDNVNYGNRLQAFALNYYLRNHYDYEVRSIILNSKEKQKKTKFSPIRDIVLKIYNISKSNSSINYRVFKRKELCNNFTQAYTILDQNMCMSFFELKKTKYNMFIVGSDVVWAQSNRAVNKIKFLDFSNSVDECIKISYGASFGRDYIPNNNKKYINKCLSQFAKISVREKSSIKLLHKIGIKNVDHVCDPTLLLDKNTWREMEMNPNIINDNFVFVYLLGKNREQREIIKEFAKKNHLIIVNVPYANGKYSSNECDFANINFLDCSPQNWLWLINNSNYVFTDSFHGTVFSIIFEKKFFVFSRDIETDINNRMVDFLKTINQNDKYINDESFIDLNEYMWDYSKINHNVDKFVNSSKEYIKECINLLSKEEKNE
jgi:hypothetical protein